MDDKRRRGGWRAQGYASSWENDKRRHGGWRAQGYASSWDHDEGDSDAGCHEGQGWGKEWGDG